MKNTPAFKAMTATQSTAALLNILDTLDAARIPGPISGMMIIPTNEERMVYAAVADTIEAREGLEEALERIFMDDDYAGTYADALRQSIEETLGGFICKQCDGPAPMGIGYASSLPGAGVASISLTECACGYSVRL